MATAAAKTKPDAAPTLAAVPEPSWEPKGAAAKLAYIQAHIGFVEKTGTNTHQKFDYFQEHGILALLRPFQRQLKVAIITSFEPATVEGNMTSSTVKVMLVDCEAAGDDPDRAVWGTFPAQATDQHGWGAAKMLTYGKKFALQKFFGIPAEELPEAEREAVEQSLGVERPIGTTDPAAVAELRTALVDGNADAQRVKGKLTADFRCQRIEDLLPSQVADFKTWVLAETAKVATPKEATP